MTIHCGSNKGDAILILMAVNYNEIENGIHSY